MTTLDWALAYRKERSWWVIPVDGKNPHRPLGNGWQNVRLDEKGLAAQFGNGAPWNIGLVLGPPSGGVVDLDCDHPLAPKLAAHLAPPTRSVFGRAGHPMSHRLYVCSPAVHRTKPLLGLDEKKPLVEVRGNGQTVVPGSVHDLTGEAIRWDEDGKLGQTTWEDLMRVAERIAAAVLLAPYWNDGSRHYFRLYVAGTLLPRGWSKDEVIGYLTAIMRARPDLPDQTVDEIWRDVTSTQQSLAQDKPTTGLPNLRALIGNDAVMDRIASLLHLGPLPREGGEAPLPPTPPTQSGKDQTPAPDDRSAATEHLIHLRPRMLQVLEELEQPLPAGGLAGLSTGLLDVDRALGGLRPGELIAVAGRPGSGKSAFALSLMQHAVVRTRARTLYVSLEMAADDLIMRLLSAESGVPLRSLRERTLDDLAWGQLNAASARLCEGTEEEDPRCDHIIADIGTYTTKQLRADAQMLHQDRPLDLIIVDYLQLMRPTLKTDNRVQQVGQMSRDLKALAREMEVPVVVLSQLNREAEHRGDHRPQLYDLRESGDIEQDCDIVLMLYREDLYTPNLPADDKPMTELLIRKHRNGPTGMVPLYFLAEVTRFVSAASTAWRGV